MTFRQFQRLTAGQLNKALAETGAQAGEAAAAPYATAAAASATAAASSASAAAADRIAAEAAVTAGFAIMPAAGLFATPLTVAPGGYTWGTSGSNITLTITTTTDDASADLAYPYGSAWEMSDPSRIMRAQDPDTGEWLPLQTYHPTV